MTYNQLTKDEVNERLKEKHIEIIGDYQNSKTKTIFKCLVCGKEFESRYDNVRYLKGRGCSECGMKEGYNKRRMKTLLKNKSEYVEIISVNFDTNQVLCKCLLCNEEYVSSYDSIKNGAKHKKCASIVCNSMSNTFSGLDIEKRMNDYGKDISVLEYDIFSPDEIKCKCNICNNVWVAKRRNLLRGYGCPECAKQNRALHRMREIINWYEILESHNLELLQIVDSHPFITNTTKIMVRCKNPNCAYTFTTSLYYLERYNINCKKCNEKERAHQSCIDFIEELSGKNSSITMIGNFISRSDVVLFRCEECGYEFYKTPHDLLRFSSCPKCVTNSALEYRIKLFLKSNNLDFDIHKRYLDLKGVNCGLLSYDFYLPNYNLLIEGQGQQHEYPIEYFGGENQFKIQQEHDRRKRDYAKTHNIDLLEIWYRDYENIEEILYKKLNINNNQKSA